MSIRVLLLMLPFGAAVGMAGCSGDADPFRAVNMEWTRVAPPEGNLPPGVRLESGQNREFPLLAWAVHVDPEAPRVSIGVVSADEPDGRATPSDLARASGACILVNGGFYWIDEGNRARHIGLLVRDGVTLEPALDGVLWRQVRYPTARAVFGADSSGHPVIHWANASGDTVRVWSKPFPNALGVPAPVPSRSEAAAWQPRWALSAGPALVVEGRPAVTRQEEAFFDAHMPRIHPRSAAGVTADGQVILVVVDGRQPRSRGVTLEELAIILRDLGAVWALNLDGGGSSAMVVNGRLINRPAGSDEEREIVSAITVSCE